MEIFMCDDCGKPFEAKVTGVFCPECSKKYQRKHCPYCHTDCDGYAQFLPRAGIGNAHIWHESFDGRWILHFSGKYRTEAKININFCPMCGRELKVGR
jgi:DNA-directed RNA polymerase subunit RPC12/RpoP